MRAIVLLIVSFATVCADAAAGIDFPITPGRYAVGYRVVHQRDPARTFPGEANAAGARELVARPIQTLVWYPADKGTSPMPYREYFSLNVTRTKFDRAPEESARLAEEQFIKTFGWTKDQIVLEGTRKTTAHRDAVPVAGEFPVVIYAPSFGAPSWENTDLCEFLASLGYVVLASPSIGAAGIRMEQELVGIEAQAADIQFLINYAKGLPQADSSQIAVIGYSWGGVANVLAAADDPRIRALVIIDGTIGYYPARLNAKGVTPAKLKVPVLFFSELARDNKDMPAAMRVGFVPGHTFLHEMDYPDVYIFRMNSLFHPEFSALRAREVSPTLIKENRLEGIRSSYGWVMRYTGEFLNAYLKKDKGGLAFLARAPKENGVPAELMTMELTRKEGKKK